MTSYVWCKGAISKNSSEYETRANAKIEEASPQYYLKLLMVMMVVIMVMMMVVMR